MNFHVTTGIHYTTFMLLAQPSLSLSPALPSIRCSLYTQCTALLPPDSLRHREFPNAASIILTWPSANLNLLIQYHPPIAVSLDNIRGLVLTLLLVWARTRTIDSELFEQTHRWPDHRDGVGLLEDTYEECKIELGLQSQHRSWDKRRLHLAKQQLEEWKNK